jgi:hypothetical protein
MKRISSLFLATSLVVLPVAAFAQQTTAPVAAPVAQPATHQIAQPATQMTKTDAKAPSVKMSVATKDIRTTHSKPGTTTPTAPAKTAEPSKS